MFIFNSMLHPLFCGIFFFFKWFEKLSLDEKKTGFVFRYNKILVYFNLLNGDCEIINDTQTHMHITDLTHVHRWSWINQRQIEESFAQKSRVIKRIQSNLDLWTHYIIIAKQFYNQLMIMTMTMMMMLSPIVWICK